ncbi:MAG: hypothetical protein DIU69_09585 [Bacillota bacterium]|nr:MAG: hypothetical protein DIU69_09585 [Bacillota bacterium]
MRKRLLGLVAAGLAVALVLAGCGARSEDDTSRENRDDSEEVYIFPDGTTVTGEAAAWLREATAKLYPTDGYKPVDEQEAHRLLGEHFVQPNVPPRFRLVGYAHTEDEQVRIVKTYWAAPESKEWLEVALQNKPTDIRYFGKPLCDDGTEGDGKISDIYPWASHRCMAEVEIPGWYAHLWMLNVPENDAAAIATSVRDKLFALK